MEQIQKTTNYDLFKYLLGNRKLKKNHIKKLRTSIEKSNHLNLHPIIVNQNYEVIDGQHRLEVARQLGLEIYYFKSEIISDHHLIDSNVNQQTWEVENYIDYFALKENKPQYILLKQMMKQTKLKPKALITLILGSISNEFLEFLKTGKFIFPTSQDYNKILSFYCDFCAYINDKKIRPFSMFTNFNFTKALRWIYKTTGFEYNIFFKKLDLRWFDLKPQRSSREWYELLINIYNYKNHSKIDEEYDKTT
jgi:hypothetical protein